MGGFIRATVSRWLRLSIPKLVKEVFDLFEIASSQLMPNMWRLLMSLECLSIRQNVEYKLGEVLYTYYLKEHDKERGCY